MSNYTYGGIQRMPSITETIQLIESKEFQRTLESLYGDVPSIINDQKQRYKTLVQEYVKNLQRAKCFSLAHQGAVKLVAIIQIII